MDILPQVTQAMQTLLTTTADAMARQTGFIQRQRKLRGSGFVQTLVFSWLSNPQARVEDLAQTAGLVGVEITGQGIDKRFTREAAHCLQGVLGAAVRVLIGAQAVAVPLLQRFTGVYVLDSTGITLPQALAAEWPGCGGSGSARTTAALKVQVGLDLTTGGIQGFELQAGKASDRSSAPQQAPLPERALRMADLGYFDLEVLQALERQGGYWLTRVQAGTGVWDATGQRWELGALVQAQGRDRIDVPIGLGTTHRLACRLLAVRVSPQEAERRRRALHKEARRRGQTVSQARLAWADWTIFVTNVPSELLSLEDALVLARARWQIELLFKLWKSEGQIDEWRSAKPWRILCEVYGKLLAMILQHWVLLATCWQYADRSLRKAAHTVRLHALGLAQALGEATALRAVLAGIQRSLRVSGRINKRKTKPATFQRLLALTPGGLS